MYSLIIEQIICNSDYQNLDLAFQDQLNDSKIVSGVSYWTIDFFENHSFNNQTVSPNWLCSSFYLGFIDPTTNSLSFLQSQFSDRNINFFNDFSETFWSEYEPIHEVTNLYGNVADGKTHLDSVAEAVFNAVLGALESFVKKVTELASEFFNWIWNYIKQITKPIWKPIDDAIQSAKNKVIEFTNLNINYFVIGRGAHEFSALQNILFLLMYYIILALLSVTLTLAIIFMVIMGVLNGITSMLSGGFSSISSKIAESSVGKGIKEGFKTLLKGTASFQANSFNILLALAGLGIGYVMENAMPSGATGAATNLYLSLFIGFAATAVQIFLAMQDIGRLSFFLAGAEKTGIKVLAKSPSNFGKIFKNVVMKDLDIWALVIILIFSFIGPVFESQVEKDQNYLLSFYIALICTVVSGIAFLIACGNDGILDNSLDFPWNYLDEMIGGFMTFVDIGGLYNKYEQI
jgi:hypothetical protein